MSKTPEGVYEYVNRSRIITTKNSLQVLNTLQSLTVFAEPVEDVPSHQVALLSTPSDTEQWQSLETRTPPSAQTLNFRIPAGNAYQVFFV